MGKIDENNLLMFDLYESLDENIRKKRKMMCLLSEIAKSFGVQTDIRKWLKK